MDKETLLEKLTKIKMYPRFLISEEDLMRIIDLARSNKYYQILKTPDDMVLTIVFALSEGAALDGVGDIITLRKEF